MYAARQISDWLKTSLFIEKLNNGFGLVLLLTAGAFFAFLTGWFGLKTGLIFIAGIAAAPLIFAAMFNHQFGISLMLLIGFLVHLISKYSNAPVGTSMDGLMFLMLFGILVSQSRQKEKSFAKSPISFLVIAWVVYNLFEGLNPWAESKLAWIYTVRTMALLIFVYFIACRAFTSLERIKGMLIWIIVLLFGAALYGLKQELIGFSAAEEAWIYADELRFQLLFQWTRMRIFSLLNDPTTFGIMMAYGGILCVILATGPFKSWKKIALVVAGLTMFWTMAYTGTRTAYVLVPIGLFLFAMLTLTRNVLIAATFFLLTGTVFMMKSTSNPLIFRIQSAFRVTEDESMQVRFENQKFIQPFIRSHPIGAGLGSTGVWGKRFTPDSWLANFPHDSGFVRIAVEQGWIGLIIYLAMLFVAMQQALYYYLRVKDPTIKIMYLGILAVIFLLTVASYPQEIIVHLPSSLIFYIFLAAIVRLKDFDPNFATVKESNPDE